MIRAIKNYIIGWKVCRKYGIHYSGVYKKNLGFYSYVHETIAVNPFSKNFEEIFFHEVGHLVHHRMVNYFEYLQATEESVFVFSNGSFERRLIAESFASRFAMKYLKKDSTYLVKAFNTYTKDLFSIKGLSNSNLFTFAVDLTYELTRRIQKY